MSRSIALFLFIFQSSLFAQPNGAFKIIGICKYYDNQNILVQGGAFFQDYNDFTFERDGSDADKNSFRNIRVTNGQFIINGKLRYPHPFAFSYYDEGNNRGYTSTIFFVDDGNVSVEVGDLSKDRSLGSLSLSKSNVEYSHLRRLYSACIDTVTGEILDMPGKQRILQKYIAVHPESYVALWDMVLDYPFVKSDSIKKTILSNTQYFSYELKRTRTYKAFVSNIEHDLELGVGEKFPNIRIGSADSIYSIVGINEYTLVDFWFSSCKPCLQQFPEFKDIYMRYKSKKFEIVGISVDSWKYFENWQAVIKKFDLTWVQYLDLGGIESDRMYIRKFPTNYLINRKGQIVGRDISPKELKYILQNKLDTDGLD